MIIALWVLCLVLLIGTVVLLSWLLAENPRYKEGFLTVFNGFRAALKDCGFTSKRKYPVELWRWETMDDEDVCDDCLERSTWPPMDIADWMKEGIPATPEAETECGEHCRCRLVRYRHTPAFKKHPDKNF